MRRSLLLLLCACNTGDPPAPSGGPSAPAPPRAKGPTWELLVSSDYGPCAEDDPRSCHTTWTVHADGVIAKVAQSNDPKKSPASTTITMSPFDRDAMRKLVASSEFHDGIAKGFACQGESHDPDATIRFEFVDSKGAHGLQFIEHCTRGTDADKNLPTQLFALVRR